MAESDGQRGLILKNNSIIQEFLRGIKAKVNTEVQSCDSTAASYVPSDEVPYATIRDLWLRQEPSLRPRLSTLLSGIEFVYDSPKPREKSKELKERLQRLQEIADKKAYDKLVSDVVSEDNEKEPFSSYTTQLGFGLQVLVTMFAGYLFGHLAFRSLFGNNPAMKAAGGICGLICGMLLETVIFIFKSSFTRLPSAKTTLSKAAPSHIKMKKTKLL